MRASKLLAVAIGLTVWCAATPASAATDPCDKAIFDAMATKATEGFKSMDGVIESLMTLPQPTQSSNCLGDIFSVWDLDPKAMAVEAIGSAFGPGMLGYTMSGVTLSGSNPLVKPVMSLVDDIFDSFIGDNICGELWKVMGEAMKPLNYVIDASGKVNMVMGAARAIDSGSLPISFKGVKGTIKWK